MIPRLVLLAFLIGSPFVLSGCSVVKAPFNMMGRMMDAGSRSLFKTAGNDAVKRFRLEAGELERARGTEPMTPAPETVDLADQVAQR